MAKEALTEQVAWLGMAVARRGAPVTTDGGLPSERTVKTGLKHLEGYISLKRNIYTPKTSPDDYGNFIMLGYYRNPLNFIFFNESIIVSALFSVGVERGWQEGLPMETLFEKACYLADLMRREEVLKDRLTLNNRAYFD